jgi:hypothetical protein
MNAITLKLPKTASDHARRLVEQLGEKFDAMDSDVAACYGMICQTLEELPDMDLTDKDRVALQAKLVTTLGTLRRSMGMTADERRKASGATRIGRPPKNAVWEDVDV